MKEYPILYSTPMIQAKLAGRKTQTRRIIKVQPEEQLHPCGSSKWYWSTNPSDLKIPYVKCPYGQIGDLIWARESWAYAEDEFGNHSSTTNGDCFGKFLYKANGDDNHDRWKPSIHMPKEASRIWERITDIRVERLQDISEGDAIAEGIQPLLASGAQLATHGRLYKHYTEHQEGLFGTGLKPVKSYQTLWESINGDGSWDLSPWVWVIETEILSTTGRPAGLAVSKTEMV